MVFASSCSDSDRLGTGLVVPARAECCGSEHLLEEAEQLWAAELDTDAVGGICADWGGVLIKPNPALTPENATLQGWQGHFRSCAAAYEDWPKANGESSIVDRSSGVAAFNWPTDVETGLALEGFDLILMTATKATVIDDQYPAPEEIANAWRADQEGHVVYFYNNRHHGISTFEDARIEELLTPGPSITGMQPLVQKTSRG